MFIVYTNSAFLDAPFPFVHMQLYRLMDKIYFWSSKERNVVIIRLTGASAQPFSVLGKCPTQ